MLGIIQFPWRLITYASFGLVILDVIFVSEITLKTLRYIAYILVSLLLIFFNLKFFQPQLFLPLNDGSFLTKENYDLVAQNKIPEYLPAWMPDFPASSSNDGLTRTPTKVFGTIEVSNTEVRVETAYMPQWQLKLDGKVTPITPASDGAITTKNKLSPGIYNLELTWVRTNLEKLSILITIVSLLVVIGLAI